MSTVDVLDAAGNTVPIEKPLAPGRAAAAASKPVALCSEDFARLSTASALNVVDVASVAITANTSTTITPDNAGGVYVVTVPVTVVTGTNPTLDIVVYESDDDGVNYFPVFFFPRITATGVYRSAPLPYRGNRVRYVETTGGTTPSFTRSIVRNSKPAGQSAIWQFIDRVAVLATADSASAAFFCEGVTRLELTLVVTTFANAATLDLQVSKDGVNWVTLAPLLITAIGTSRLSFGDVSASFVRTKVSSPGSGTIQDHTVIRGF